MKNTATAILAAASLIALASCRQTTAGGNAGNASGSENGSAAAGSSIDGTWKTDLSTIKTERKPDQFLLQGGQFSCPTCVPPLTVAADGNFHPVTGRPYADHISIKVDDDHNVTRIGQKNGKTTSTVKYTVSADGNTLTANFTDSSTPGAKPVTGSLKGTRVAPGPAGSHLISGSWKLGGYNNMSEEGLTATFKEENSVLHMSTASGQSYDAKLDGSDTPIKGDIGGTTASVKKLSDNVYQETDKRGGKVVDVMTMTVGADGTMSVKDESTQMGAVTTYTAKKQ
jgi:hypothetical protein